MEKKKNPTLSLVSFIGSIITFVLFLFYPDEDTLVIDISVASLIFVILIVLSIVSICKANKNDEPKGFGIAGLVISIINLLLAMICAIGLFAANNVEYSNEIYCPLASECVKTDNDTTTCVYSGLEVKCYTKQLENIQFNEEGNEENEEIIEQNS